MVVCQTNLSIATESIMRRAARYCHAAAHGGQIMAPIEVTVSHHRTKIHAVLSVAPELPALYRLRRRW